MPRAIVMCQRGRVGAQRNARVAARCQPPLVTTLSTQKYDDENKSCSIAEPAASLRRSNIHSDTMAPVRSQIPSREGVLSTKIATMTMSALCGSCDRRRQSMKNLHNAMSYETVHNPPQDKNYVSSISTTNSESKQTRS